MSDRPVTDMPWTGETETLIGGLCDGLEIPATDSPHMYADRLGSGFTGLYLRGADGRLRFSHRIRVTQPVTYKTTNSAFTMTIECKAVRP